MMTAFLLKSSLLHTPERLNSFIIKPSDQKKKRKNAWEKEEKKREQCIESQTEVATERRETVPKPWYSLNVKTNLHYFLFRWCS